MSLVYVFVASKIERGPVERLMNPLVQDSVTPNKKVGRIASNEVVLFSTGIGPNRARTCADAVFSRRVTTTSAGGHSFTAPDAAIIIGLCGGLSPSVAETDLVIYTKSLSTEPGKASLACSSELMARLNSVLQLKGLVCASVGGITSPRVATTPMEKRTLAKSGAEVVDMESYEIIAAASRAGVPVAVVRVVSDGVDRAMPDFNRAMKPNGEIDGRIAIRICFSHPIITARLFAASRRAIQKLGQAAEAILTADSYSGYSFEKAL
jgi:nucleoside phosphorylase